MSSFRYFFSFHKNYLHLIKPVTISPLGKSINLFKDTDGL